MKKTDDYQNKLRKKEHWTLSTIKCSYPLEIKNKNHCTLLRIKSSHWIFLRIYWLNAYKWFYECNYPHLMPLPMRTWGIHPGRDRRHSDILPLQWSWPPSCVLWLHVFPESQDLCKQAKREAYWWTEIWQTPNTIRSTTFKSERQKHRKYQRIMSQVRLHYIKVFVVFLETKLPLRKSKM